MRKISVFVCALCGPVWAASVDDLTYTISAANEVTITDCLTTASGVLEIPEVIEGNPVVEISNGAFSNCVSLTDLTIPSSVRNIRDGAFEGCTGLTAIDFPEGITGMSQNLLRDCSSLTTVTIPSTVRTVRTSSFAGMTSLTSFVVADGSAHFVAVDGVLYSTDLTRIFKYPEGLTDVSFVIPDGVEVVEQNAFRDSNVNLVEVTIPASLTTIGGAAFQQCGSLSTVKFKGAAPSQSNRWAFWQNSQPITALVSPDHAASFGGDGATWNNHLTVQVDVASDGPLITSISVEPGDAATLTILGSPSTEYTCLSSVDLQAFDPILTTPQTVTTDSSGVASFQIDASELKKFFVVEGASAAE